MGVGVAARWLISMALGAAAALALSGRASADGAASAADADALLSSELRSLERCRTQYAGVTPHVPGYCYADALFTLLARDATRSRSRPRLPEALAAFIANRPTFTADAAARYRLLWQAAPHGPSVMRALSTAQAGVSRAVYLEQWTAARAQHGSTVLTLSPAGRGGPPSWAMNYARAENGVLGALGWRTNDLPMYDTVREDLAPDSKPPLALELAAAGARYQRWVRQRPTLAALFAALPKETAYLEFVEYHGLATVDPLAPGHAGADRRPPGESRYFAFAAWQEGSNLRVSGADLGSVAAIDLQVRTLRQHITQLEPLTTLPNQLYQTLLAPFATALRSAKQLVISADGTLNLLPFEVLQPEAGHYLADRSVILYGNARDVLSDELMAPWLSQQPTAPGLIVADPAYDGVPYPAAAVDTDACGVGKQRGVFMAQVPSFPPKFTRLACTKPEADAISQQSPTPLEVLSGVAATETALRRRERPEFLHFATHGFLLEPPAVRQRAGGPGLSYESLQSAPIETRLLVDPLLAAAIALSGANGRSSGLGALSASDDGLLSAAEVQRLNLGGTRLVVLSACDTGDGLPGTGRAFFGLRQAFRSAGASAVVGSLWSVSDVTTAWLMSAFYARFFAGDAPAVALQRARVEVRTKCAACDQPFYWAPFVMEGAAAALRPRVAPAPH